MGKQKKRKQPPTRRVLTPQQAESRPRPLRIIGAWLLVLVLVAGVVVPLTLGPGEPAGDTSLSRYSRAKDSTLAAYGTEPGRLSVPSERDFKLLIPGPHRSPVMHIAFNQTGRYMASLGSQNDIKIWDTERRALISELVHTGEGRLLSLAFGPETGTDWALVGGLDSGDLLYIDRQFRIKYRTEVQPGEAIRAVFLSGDNSSIVAIGEYRCSLVNINSREVLAIKLFWHDDNHFCPRLTYDGKPLDGDDPGKPVEFSVFGIRSWATVPNSPLLALGCANLYLQPNPRPVREPVQPGPDGLYVLYPDPADPLLQPGGKTRGHGYGAANPPNVLSVDLNQWRDYWKLIDAYSHPFQLQTRTAIESREFDIKPWAEPDLTQLRSIFGMDFSPSGDLLATAHDDNHLRLWSTRFNQDEVPDNAVVGGRTFASPLCGVKFSPNGTSIAVAEAASDRLRVHLLRNIDSREAPDVNLLVNKKTKKALFVIEPGEEAPLARSIDIPESGFAPNVTTMATLSWSRDAETVFAWSWRTGALYSVPTKQGKPVGLAENVTAFSSHASSDRFAFGDGEGNVRLRDCSEPTKDISLLTPSVPGNVLMPAEAPFPPPWVFTPYGSLTLTEALTGRLLLRDVNLNSWYTFLSGTRAFVFSGKGRLFNVDLSAKPQPTRGLASPLGAWGAAAPINGNQSMEYLFARVYGVELVPKGDDQTALKPFSEWKAGPRIPKSSYLSVVHSDLFSQLICAGGAAKSVFAVDLKSGRSQPLLSVPDGALCRLALGGSKRYAVAWWVEDAENRNVERTMRHNEQPSGTNTRITVIDLAQGRVVRTWAVPGICSAFDAARDQTRLVGVWGSTVRVWDFVTGQELLNEQVHAKIRIELYLDPWTSIDNWQREQSRPWYLASAALSTDGTTVYLWDETRNFMHRRLGEKDWKGNLHVIDTQTMARPAWKRGTHLISKSGRWIAFSGDGNNLRLLDTTNRRMHALTGHLGYAYPACFSADEKYLITSGGDGALRTWRLDPLDELVEFRMFANGDWLARTPDGFWDGSTEGLRRARLVSGTAVGELDGNYGLWRPGLVEYLLQGGIFESGNEPERSGFSRRPLVRVSGPSTVDAPEVKLEVDIMGRGAQPNALMAFVNGKLASSVSVTMLPGGRKTETIPVPLGSGQNRIELVVGTTGVTRSDKAVIVVKRSGAPPQRLFVISVGVNGRQLRHARSDALRVAETLRRRATSLYPDPAVTTLVDIDATKAGITKAVGEYARQAEPQDVFVFYFAGHGNVFEQSGTRTATLSPYDALGQAPNSALAISSKDIADWATLIEAQRQLWVFDACGTGTFSSHFSEVAFSQDFRRLQSNVGCYIIAGIEKMPDGAEEIKERPSLQGGVLTTALIEFLSQSPRGSVEDLGVYVKRRVPELYGTTVEHTVKHIPAVLLPPKETRKQFLLASD